MIGHAERDARLQCRCVPPGNERRNHGLVAAGRDAEEIDDRHAVLERLAKPSVVGRIRVLAHEGIVDRLVALENLPMHFALVVVPDLAARLRENGLDRQQEAHLLRLEDARAAG